ncbi:MAG: cohesin domain-containing protein [Patescibacteria group bacterium]
MNKLITTSLIFLGGVALASGNPVFYLETENLKIGSNSDFIVSVLVNSDNSVNAYDIIINYPKDLLNLVAVNSSNSIVDFFKYSEETKPGVIKIVGGSIQGFEGEAGNIIKLNFKSKAEGEAEISLESASAYLYDGTGMQVVGDTKSIKLVIDKKTPSTEIVIKDKIPPVIDEVSIVKDPVQQESLLVFNATDEDSGVKSATVRYREWLGWGDRIPISNPSQLASGVWSLELRVVDNNGNVTAQTVYLWGELFRKLIYISFVVFVLLFFLKKVQSFSRI